MLYPKTYTYVTQVCFTTYTLLSIILCEEIESLSPTRIAKDFSTVFRIHCNEFRNTVLLKFVFYEHMSLAIYTSFSLEKLNYLRILITSAAIEHGRLYAIC
jgi:hypothetical protein